ncbi:unnamed protein product [Calypogeia fissa]
MVQEGAKMVERGAEMGKGRGALDQSQPGIGGRSESLEGPRGTERSKGLWRGDHRRFPHKSRGRDEESSPSSRHSRL